MNVNVRLPNSCCLYLLISVSLLSCKIKPATAQSTVINGLFNPTQSQQFFEAGRKKFEREVEIVNNPAKYLNQDLLKIDPATLEQMHQSPQQSYFPSDAGEYNLASEYAID